MVTTATTGADGTYSFVGLPLGTYTLTETQPAGYTDGKDKLGTSGGTLGNDNVTSITLGTGAATGYDFGELQTGSLGNFVWEDLNGNGTQDSGEPGIAGVTVTLSGLDDLGAPVSATATTDATGAYLFANLRAGSYTVAFTTPSGYVAAPLNVGDDTTDSDGASVAEILAWGENNLTLDTGYVRRSTISGNVYVDADNDGVLDAGETPIAGTTVTLAGTDGAGNPINLSTTTDGGRHLQLPQPAAPAPTR